MKITRRQLKRIINEAIQGYVHGDPTKDRFLDLVMGHMSRSDYRRAAGSIMDSYMIDDVFPEDEQLLVDLLSQATSGSPQEIESIADRWFNQTFRRER